MKKTLLSIVVVGVAFVLSGCGNKTETPEQNAPQVQTQKDSKAAGSAISSIKDAMGLGTKMKCEYSMNVGGGDPIKSTAYIEGKKYKLVGTFNGAAQNTIFDGETMYFWQEGQKTGMKMTMICLNEMKASLPQGQASPPGVVPPEDQFKDATETSCSPTSESVSFSVPSDVTFQDQCEMMKGFLKNLRSDVPASAPTGIPANIPNMPKVPGMPAQ